MEQMKPDPFLKNSDLIYFKSGDVTFSVDDPYVTELIAGQSIDVGEVQVWDDGEYLYVRYLIDADLTPDDPGDDSSQTLIYETHVAIASSFEDIPQTKKGQPKIGHFPYSNSFETGVTEVMHEIKLDINPDEPVYISAHAVVKKLGGITGLETTLPEEVTMSVTYPGTEYGSFSYFDVTVTGGTMLDGMYDSWCIDVDNVIYPDSSYMAGVYSSYEDLPADIVEYPENLVYVNWIINQDFVGKTSPGGFGTYTWGDIQVAVWTLIDDNLSASVGSFSPDRVQEIVDAAYASGEDFSPECGEHVAVIIVPTGTTQLVIAQVTLIEVKVPCDDIEETAWGKGNDFIKKNWAMYFIY
jgi:hypothetical protein